MLELLKSFTYSSYTISHIISIRTEQALAISQVRLRIIKTWSYSRACWSLETLWNTLPETARLDSICIIMLAHVISANILVNMPFCRTRRSKDMYDMSCDLFGFQRGAIDCQFHIIYTPGWVKPIKHYMFATGDSTTQTTEPPRRADEEFLLAEMTSSSTAATQHLVLVQQTTDLEAILVSRSFLFNYTVDDLPGLFLLKNATVKPIIENYWTSYFVTTKFLSGIGFCKFSVMGTRDNTSPSPHR